ncbi:unnamed protein product [Acanthocheilonema viteae]|uniref:Uncharacterized protein n=1 Tax=Acanthocheilonema viteae TaxID=6277 RepID=A0A498SDD9_ACAVI|nr:unnamed protein product [Acanthocheilonema viteae]
MVKGRKNKPYRQMGERFPSKSKKCINLGGSTNDGAGQPKEPQNHPNRNIQQNNPKKRVLANSPPTNNAAAVTQPNNFPHFKRQKIELPKNAAVMGGYGQVKITSLLVPTVIYRRHFYGYTEEDIYANEPELACSICHSMVLQKFLELHAWMHLSWLVQVGDRYPFQCTCCDFSAFRIPDVICHAKETHGYVGASLFVPTVSDQILDFFLKKVIECFPPTNPTTTN